MPSFNRTLTMGNLTRDPEVRYTPSGTAVANFGLAVNETYMKDGQKQESSIFIDFTAWGKTAENIGKYFKKGDPIFIEGRLKLETWNDKQTNEKRSRLGVVVETFQFIGGKKNDGGNQSPPRQQQRPAKNGAPANQPDDDWDTNPPF